MKPRADFLWLCPLLSIALAAGVLVVLGLSPWTAVLAAAMLACPIAALWAYFSGRLSRSRSRPLVAAAAEPIEPVPSVHTHGVTLSWLAPVYDALCMRMGLGAAFRERTLGYAGPRPGERVLDVGCGTGVLTRVAGEAVGPSGYAMGIDPAPRMIELARRAAARAQSKAEFRLAAIEALPFEDHTFDMVTASLMVHHLPPDLKCRGLREVYRVLKPSGRLVVVDLDRPHDPLWWLLVWPLLLMPTAVPNLRGEIPDYLRGAGFDEVQEVGRWGSLLTFWAAKKPGRSLRSSKAEAPGELAASPLFP